VLATLAHCGRQATVQLGLLVLLPLSALPTSNPAIHLQRSVQLMQEGDLASAEAQARLALADPASNPVALALLGSIRLQQNEYAEGRDFLKQAISANPDLLGARLNLAQAYALLGHNQSAEDSFREVLKRAPDNTNALLGLVRLVAEKGDHAGALDLARPIQQQLRASPDGLQLLAVCFTGTGRLAEARALLADWERLSGVPPSWTVKFALTLSKGGLNPRAIQLLEGLKRDGLSSFEVVFNLGGFYLLENDLGKASENYELAVRMNDQSVPALKQVAMIAEEQGELEKALSFLIRAKLEAPDDPDILFSFGTVALRLELIADATAALEKGLELRSGHTATRYWLGTAYGAGGHYDESLALYRSILDENPNNAQMQYAVGTVYYLKFAFEDAIRHLKESFRLDPDQVQSGYFLAMIAQKQGKNHEAIRMFEEILASHPGHTLSHEGLAMSQFRLKQYEKARNSFQAAIRLNPQSARANYQFGQLLVRMGLREEAQQQLAIAKQLREEEESRQVVKTLLNPH
jgi:tetratricopeptide (TPR) repeat protein